MRQVLGDDQLHYFGISYGTELGGVYAHLFPKNVGRAVFDAVVDPDAGVEDGALGQAKGFQLALDNFAQDCVDRGDACTLPGSTAAEIETFVTDLLASSTRSRSPASANASSPRRRPPTASRRPSTPRSSGPIWSRASPTPRAATGRCSSPSRTR